MGDIVLRAKSLNRSDVLMMLSFSGQTDELVSLAAVARQHDIPVLSITSGRSCRIAQLAAYSLIVGDLDEDQRKRLMEIADRCPVHKTLMGEIRIESDEVIAA